MGSIDDRVKSASCAGCYLSASPSQLSHVGGRFVSCSKPAIFPCPAPFAGSLKYVQCLAKLLTDRFGELNFHVAFCELGNQIST